MPKTIHSTWYQNGEDVFFTDDAFHELAYKITNTYQRFMGKMELEYGEKKARHEAWARGWKHKHEMGIGSQGQLFSLPGYELQINTRFDDRGLHFEARINILFE